MNKIFCTSLLLLATVSKLLCQNVGVNTTNPLSTLSVNGDFALHSDTFNLFCNEFIYINNQIKRKSVIHLVSPDTCFVFPTLTGIKNGNDGEVVHIFNHIKKPYIFISDYRDSYLPPAIHDSMSMIELFEEGIDTIVNRNYFIRLNTGGSISFIYDGIRKRWKPLNSYSLYSDLKGTWLKTPTGNVMFTFDSLGINKGYAQEQVDIDGNIRLSGLIKPNGGSGSIGQVLSNNGNGTMSWANPASSWSYDDQNIYNNNLGFVGIGGPPYNGFNLDVTGNGIFTKGLVNSDNLDLSTSVLAIQKLNSSPSGESYLKMDERSIQSAFHNTFPSFTNATALFINPYGGQVAIGTNKNLVSGGYKLAVNGSVKCREVVVENVNWPDYVFEPSYPLMSISEFEKFIKENGHLPNIPKATQIEKEGQPIGQIQKLMMEKIEELSLYIIELKNEIELLKMKSK